MDIAVIYIDKLKWFTKDNNIIIPKDFSSNIKLDMQLAGFPSLINEEKLDLSYLPIDVKIQDFVCPSIMLSIKDTFFTQRIYLEDAIVGMSGGPLYCEINDKVYFFGITKRIPVNENGEAIYNFIFVLHIEWYIDKIKELYSRDIILPKEEILIVDKAINETALESILLNREWFNSRLKESIANLGERYSEELDIPINEEKILEYICFSPKDNRNVVKKLEEIEEVLIKNISEKSLSAVSNEFNVCKNFVNEYIEKGKKYEQEYVSKVFDKLIKICNEADRKKTSISRINIIDKLHNIDGKNLNTKNEIYFYKNINELEKIKEYLNFMVEPYLLITGEPGIGKSHFIAHCAKKHFESMGISVLVLGHLLKNDKPILTQIKEVLDIECSIDEFLHILNRYGKKNKKRSVIFFDGLNECNSRWKDDILGFIKRVESYPWIGVIMSLRSNIMAESEEQLTSKYKMKKIKLQGLSNVENAISEFSTYYNIPVSRSNNLEYILNTPLLLKLYCISYSEQEEGNFICLKSIINGYISHVNKKICLKKGYSSKTKIIKRMINIFVDIILETGKRKVNFDDYEMKLNQSDTSVIQNNLIDELIGEGILSDVCEKKNGEEIYWIDFEYELFGDYFITDRILELEKVEEFNNSQQLSDLFSSENQYFEFLSDSRILEMLTVLLPDIKCKYEVGGFEIINWPYEIKERIYKDTFFNSLFLRNPKKIDRDLSYSYLLNTNRVLFYDHDRFHSLFYVVLKLCVYKEHCYNIEFLQNLFSEFTSSGFHREWTIFTSEKLYDSEEFNNVLYLALSQINMLSKREKNLLGITLSWCLVSLDENVTILCEYALLRMYEEDINGLVDILKYFSFIEFSKAAIILEKLFLISMHCIFYSNDIEGKKVMCNYVINSFNIKSSLFQKYFMIHEYAMYILDYAEEHELVLSSCIDELKNQEVGTKFDEFNSCDVGKYIKSKTRERDDFYAAYHIKYNENEDYEFEEYFTCNNDVVYSLMSLYTEIDIEYNHIEFKTEEFISLILPEYRKIFCENVISKIFEFGYNYIKLGFYDLSLFNEKSTAQIYEQMAFNIVFMKYLKNCGLIKKDKWLESSSSKEYSALWELPYYEIFDVSSVDYQFYQDGIDDNLYCADELVQMIENDKFIRIDSCRFRSNRINVYLLKISDVSISNILRVKNSQSIIEGIYFSEIFVSRGFYKYFEAEDINNEIIPVTRSYLWDYEPFSSFAILNPVLYNEMNLLISKDKLYYYHEDKIVCKNIIKENSHDKFLIDAEFLRDFLTSNKYSIVWIYKDDESKLEGKSNMIQYDGQNIRRI